ANAPPTRPRSPRRSTRPCDRVTWSAPVPLLRRPSNFSAALRWWTRCNLRRGKIRKTGWPSTTRRMTTAMTMTIGGLRRKSEMAADRIAGYSAADMAALAVLTRCQIETQQAVQKLRAIAKPKARYRYASIERPERGVVVASVQNTHTGEMRRIRVERD